MDVKKQKQQKKRYFRKRVELLRVIEKIKLWPSRQGRLHGIKHIEKYGEYIKITTHCNEVFASRNSRNSRAARWLRNKWFSGVCKSCNVPDWKLAKYNATRFSRKYGSDLTFEKELNSKSS